MKKLQSHATLEAEVARLRCLVIDIRGRIEGEIGAFLSEAGGKKDSVERSLRTWLRPHKVTWKGEEFSKS